MDSERHNVIECGGVGPTSDGGADGRRRPPPLSATLAELDEANLWFIVGSRVVKAPLDLASHLRWHGDAFTDGQVNDTKVRAEPVWDPAAHPGSWRRSGRTRPSVRHGTTRP